MNRSLMDDRDHLSLWLEPNGKFPRRQPNSPESDISGPEPSSKYSNDSISQEVPPLGLRGQAGQIIVEYVLLLVVAIGIATVVTKAMISSDKGNPGFVFATWSKVIQAIGADSADDTSP